MVLQALCIGGDTSKQHIYKQIWQNKSEKGVDSRWQQGEDGSLLFHGRLSAGVGLR